MYGNLMKSVFLALEYTVFDPTNCTVTYK